MQIASTITYDSPKAGTLGGSAECGEGELRSDFAFAIVRCNLRSGGKAYGIQKEELNPKTGVLGP